MDASPLRIAVTGHRPKDLFGYDLHHEGWQWVREELAQLIEEFSAAGACEFVSGMALGVDQVFAEEVLAARQVLVAFVPFAGQDRLWPPRARAHYRRLLERAARVVTVALQGSLQAFHDRNQAMVDHADIVVAVWSGRQRGGTFHCVQAALAAGRCVVRVDPVARHASCVGSA
jgi:uncharacterized phage-like protein YoqJ